MGAAGCRQVQLLLFAFFVAQISCNGRDGVHIQRDFRYGVLMSMTPSEKEAVRAQGLWKEGTTHLTAGEIDKIFAILDVLRAEKPTSSTKVPETIPEEEYLEGMYDEDSNNAKITDNGTHIIYDYGFYQTVILKADHKAAEALAKEKGQKAVARKPIAKKSEVSPEEPRKIKSLAKSNGNLPTETVKQPKNDPPQSSQNTVDQSGSEEKKRNEMPTTKSFPSSSLSSSPTSSSSSKPKGGLVLWQYIQVIPSKLRPSNAV